VSPEELDNALRDLPRTGKQLKVRPYRQVWRFEFGGKPYYLKFYPRNEGKLKRLIRGSSAMREFLNLKALQRADVPAPRPSGYLAGFTIDGTKGDAVILEGVEPSVQLDHHLNDLLLRGERAANHHHLAREVIGIVQKLGQAKLGHADLHLGNFLLSSGKLYLLDGYAVHSGGMRTRDVMFLGQSVGRFATTADKVRAWRTFSDAPLPKKNPVRKRQWRKQLEASTGDNRSFSRLRLSADTQVHAYKHTKFPRRWSPASQFDIAAEDWQRELPKLLERIDRNELQVLKRSPSGDVLAGELTLGGRNVQVVIKHPKRRRWYRYLNEIGRGGRARRAWFKAWSLVARDIPTAWPLLLMERRRLGYVTDSLIVFERVNGTLLADADFSAMDDLSRQTLFHRLGRTLRLLEQQGLAQYDSKMSNWIIVPDEKLGPVPLMIDVDGIRKIVPPLWPIDRLLRSLREHRQYTPQDSKWVCIGYAPHGRFVRESESLTPSPLAGEGGGEG
jgi:tRNA A-37 threonylcarbamoyl transferase component Bud32